LWQLTTPKRKLAREIEKALGLPPLVALILTTRQLTSSSQASDFLNSRLTNLPLPSQLPNLNEAVERIVTALENEEQIAVYGDYDVDGVTATALLVDFLTRLGGKVHWHLPHRIQEGYGLNSSALHHLHGQGVGLVITVDCGSSDHEPILFARELGIDMIVTDHHQPPNPLPETNALVNPKLKQEEEEFRDLAGVGVAFYLATALRTHFRQSGRWTASEQPNLKKYLDLVALGTLADMVPLTSTNRILAGVGLLELARTSRQGLRALKEICGLEESQVSDGDVLFRLGPRLNAPGRMGNADPALRLLLSTDPVEAKALARELDQINRQRQLAENTLLTEALSLVETDHSLQKSSSLVLASPGWHKGLLGLVASRLVERFNKPTILLTQVNQDWEGSGRSSGSFDLYRALNCCKDHLTSFGGHRLAAGVRLRQEQLTGFRDAFESMVKEKVPQEDISRTWKVDASVQLEEITPSLMSYLERMQPFGVGNPEPTFCCRDFQVENVRVLKGCHLQLRLRQDNVRLNAIGFNLLESEQPPPPPEWLLFSPRWNYWQGEKRLQLHIIDYC
jgi:single-stranded-DNA-specific exonuclease